MDDEREFFKRYYKYLHLLIGEGIDDNVDSRSKLLFSELWRSKERILFPETVEMM